MGSLFSSQQTQNTQQQQQTDPWAPQAAALQTGFNGAGSALTQAQGAQAPSNFTAQFTPQQLSAFGQMLNTGTNSGNIPGSSAAAGGALTGAGSTAAGQGLTGLGNYSPTNTPAAVLSAATQYANNPATQGMIDASTLDARRAVNEGAMPQIERDAAMSGNTNSNRTGIAQGITQRGLADTVANISANIRGQQFNNGLGLAQQQFAGNDASRLGALSAETSGGTNAANAGVGANTGAVGQQGGLYDIANQGIGGQMAGAQAGLTNQQQQFQSQTNSPFAALQNYMQLVGGQNWGSQSTGSGTKDTTTTPSLMAQLGAAGGIFSSLGGGGVLSGLFGGGTNYGGSPASNPMLNPATYGNSA